MRFAILAALVLAIGVTPAAADTSFSITDATWTCNKPLSRYGSLPIVVNIDYTKSDFVEFGVKLGPGCVGDANPNTVDLILHINGGSRSPNPAFGPYGDLVRITNNSPGARDLVVSGWGDCGRGRQGNHQDGVQAIGGTRITFRNWEGGTHGFNGQPTCQGAGGGFFWSSAGCPGPGCTVPVDLRIEDSVVGACGTGLRASAYSQGGSASNVVVKHRSDPNDPESCLTTSGAKYGGGPCYPPATPTVIAFENVTCDPWPFEDSSPPPPPPPPPPPAPPPPPCSGVCLKP